MTKHVQRHKMDFRRGQDKSQKCKDDESACKPPGEKVDVMIDFIKVAVCGAGTQATQSQGGSNRFGESAGIEDADHIAEAGRKGNDGRTSGSFTAFEHSRVCHVKKLVYNCEQAPAYQALAAVELEDCDGDMLALAAMSV